MALPLDFLAFTGYEGLASAILALQLPATGILLVRLGRGLFRRPPLDPIPESDAEDSLAEFISVIVPTLNEGDRIQPCLEGLHQQGKEVKEVVVVDSRSTDDTVAKVMAMQAQDPRFRVITDDPLPQGWIGRPWALHSGWLGSDETTSWILGIDADTRPQKGLAASLLRVATQEAFDLITLSPQFILEHWGEAWLQPALLMTLIYRFGPVGEPISHPERAMANGQCSLIRKSVLQSINGYTVACRSFCDDVTLVREIAKRGFKVGFLDGSRLIQVRMYTSFEETWREWGRSLDLKDASSPWQVWTDALFLIATQGLPLLLVLVTGILIPLKGDSPWLISLLALNAGLLLFRWGMVFGIRGSYATCPWTFWLSPLADPLAVIRIIRSSLSQPRVWRGRTYQDLQADT
jgi:dolichol-phosphate mannosyltransferase